MIHFLIDFLDSFHNTFIDKNIIISIKDSILIEVEGFDFFMSKEYSNFIDKNTTNLCDDDFMRIKFNFKEVLDNY